MKRVFCLDHMGLGIVARAAAFVTTVGSLLRTIGARAIVLGGLIALFLMAFGAQISLAADFEDKSGNVCEGGVTVAQKGCSEWGNHVTGTSNVALGPEMMRELKEGNNNVAIAYGALFAETTGTANVALGVESLFRNTQGFNNVASGFRALYSNTEGANNVASGFRALFSNTEGSNNVATGENALEENTTGGENVAIGVFAGKNLTTGSNNVDIASEGVAGESGTTRIGTEGTQTKAYVAGVYGKPVSAPSCAVRVSGEGQLGCSAKEVGGSSGNAAIANFASNQNVPSGQCLNFSEDEGGGLCPKKASSFPISNLLSGPIPASGATVTNLYAETNASVKGTDTVLVEAVDNTTGATLLACTVTKASKSSCSNSGSSPAIATGDKVEVRVTASGSSGNNKQWQVTFRY